MDRRWHRAVWASAASAVRTVIVTMRRAHESAQANPAATRRQDPPPDNPQPSCGVCALRITQPSSWCNSTVVEMTRTKSTGSQAATHAGASPAMPICLAISENKKKTTPPIMPVVTIVWMPPERNDRNDTVAAKRTIAKQSSGRARSVSYWMRSFSVESFALSAAWIRLGRSQNEIVKTLPRASCTRSGVR